MRPQRQGRVVITATSAAELEAVGSTGPLTRIEVVPDGVASACDFLVCVGLTAPLVLPDNLVDACFFCGRPVQYRPTAPKQPKRICMDCALAGRASVQ